MTNKLWRTLNKERGFLKDFPSSGLCHDPFLEDDATCFHGLGYKDCNEDIRVVYGGCKWWHVFPKQTLQEHVNKFHEITSNEYQIDMRSPFEK